MSIKSKVRTAGGALGIGATVTLAAILGAITGKIAEYRTQGQQPQEPSALHAPYNPADVARIASDVVTGRTAVYDRDVERIAQQLGTVWRRLDEQENETDDMRTTLQDQIDHMGPRLLPEGANPQDVIAGYEQNARELAELRERVDALGRRLGGANTDNSLENTIQRLGERITRTDETLARYDETLRGLGERIGGIQRDDGQPRERDPELQRQLEDVSRQLTEVRAQYETVQQSYADFQQTFADSRIRGLPASVEALQESLRRVDESITPLRDSYQRLERELTERIGMLEQGNEQDTAHQELEELRRNYEELNTRMAALGNLDDKLEEIRALINGQVDEQTTLLTQLRDDCGAIRRQYDEAARQLTEQSGRLGALESGGAAADSRTYTELQEQLERTHTEVVRLAGEVASLGSRVGQYESQRPQQSGGQQTHAVQPEPMTPQPETPVDLCDVDLTDLLTHPYNYERQIDDALLTTPEDPHVRAQITFIDARLRQVAQQYGGEERVRRAIAIVEEAEREMPGQKRYIRAGAADILE